MPNSTEMLVERIEFIPQIYGGDSKKDKLVVINSSEALQLASKHKKKILDWYKKHLEKGDGYYFNSAKVTMNHEGVITVEYKVSKKNKEELFIGPADILNPDDDGNHPIMKNYFLVPFKFSEKKIRITKVIRENYINSKKKSSKKKSSKKKSSKKKSSKKQSTVKVMVIVHNIDYSGKDGDLIVKNKSFGNTYKDYTYLQGQSGSNGFYHEYNVPADKMELFPSDLETFYDSLGIKNFEVIVSTDKDFIENKLGLLD